MMGRYITLSFGVKRKTAKEFFVTVLLIPFAFVLFHMASKSVGLP